MTADERLRDGSLLEERIQTLLKPSVRKIDCEAYYPLDYMTALGRDGFFRSEGERAQEVRMAGVRIVEETAAACMTTAFNVWCHLAALTYVRHSGNAALRRTLLPGLENGELRGGTGLSNPMKFYAGIDKLYLKAEREGGGYRVSGQLPMVSNLGEGHWFATVSETAGGERIMAFFPVGAEGLRLEERLGFLGLNGSATYSCSFDRVSVPEEWIVSESADEFVARVRPEFVLYQIPLGLGVTAAAIRSIRQAKEKQGGCNGLLPVQPEQLERELERLREATYRLASQLEEASAWKALLRVRLDTVYLTLQAVQANMLHQGSAGYVQTSAPSRRLREAYFFANLTPTVRHLEKLLAAQSLPVDESLL